MFENIVNFFRKLIKSDKKEAGSRDAAKERLHLVLMQDRANVSADFLELMKQEIIEVIKKYIEIDEKEIDVRLTNQANEDGTNGAPALYANIPILNIKNEMKKEVMSAEKKEMDAKIEEIQKAEQIINETNNIEEHKEDVLEENAVKFEVINSELENVAENYAQTEQVNNEDNAYGNITDNVNTRDTIYDNQDETQTDAQQVDTYSNDVHISAQGNTFESVEENNIHNV